MSLPKCITILKPFLLFLPVSVVFTGLLVYLNFTRQQLRLSQNNNQDLSGQVRQIEQQLLSLQSQDQYQINQQLQTDIKNIKTTYWQTVEAYEDLLKLKQRAAKTEDLDRLFTQIF